MSAAEKTSDLRKFLRPLGCFEPAEGGTMAEIMAAYIVCDANDVAELVDRILTSAADRLEDDGLDPVFDCDRFASKEAWLAASRRRTQTSQDILFARTILRRCFAEGVLEEKL